MKLPIVIVLSIVAYFVLAVLASIVALELENYLAYRMNNRGVDRVCKILEIVQTVLCLFSLPFLYLIGTLSIMSEKLVTWWNDDDDDDECEQ